MALINPPAWLQQGSYPAKTDRQVIESIVPVEGVITGLSVAQTTTASMSVNIGAGKGFISGTSVALQGMYNVINDATSSVTVPGSNVTNPRYDLIVITINDADVAGSTNNAVFQVISGVPSSSPAIPSIPPSTLVLARIFVGAGVSSITSAVITDVRIRTAAKGGIITVPDAASRLRLTAPVSGDMLFVSELSTGLLWRLQGTTWTPVTGETYVCTSTTRPTGVPQAFRIWETDTGQFRYYRGTSWVWDGGLKPSAYLYAGAILSPISTSASTPSGIILTASTLRGGITAVAKNGYNYVKVPDTGIYRMTVNGAVSFATGAVGSRIEMCVGIYDAANVTYLRNEPLALAYSIIGGNWISASMSATIQFLLNAGESVLPLFYRVGGSADWAVASGTQTSIQIEWVSQ